MSSPLTPESRRTRRLSPQAQAVLNALGDGEEHYGFELMRATGLKSGSLFPLLHRLEDRGVLTARWDGVDARTEGRPPRRFYRLAASLPLKSQNPEEQP